MRRTSRGHDKREEETGKDGGVLAQLFVEGCLEPTCGPVLQRTKMKATTAVLPAAGLRRTRLLRISLGQAQRTPKEPTSRSAPFKSFELEGGSTTSFCPAPGALIKSRILLHQALAGLHSGLHPVTVRQPLSGVLRRFSATATRAADWRDPPLPIMQQ